MNWRRSVVVGALVSALVGTLGVTAYLKAQSIDPDKEAYLRSQNWNAATKRTASSQVPVPHELAVGERQPSFLGGQFYMAIMNSELTDNYTEKGWRGAGRSMSPGMAMPSFTVPAGGFDSPLWASACGITAYLPASSVVGGSFGEGSFVGTNNIYRNPPHIRLETPTGFWSDQGGIGSPGLAGGTTGPGGYREPFITETVYYNNVGINVKRQSYSFSYGYGHTNDFILMRHVLTGTGDVDADIDGTFEETGATTRNFFLLFNYDFDIPTGLDPNSNNINENRGGDDKTPTGMFVDIMPRAVPTDLRASGRLADPYGPNVYTGISMMFDEDDPGTSGVDDYIWSGIRENFNPLHLGEASLLVLDGDGTGNGNNGDMTAAASTTIWEGPTVGLFHSHSWWESDWVGVFNWYAMSGSAYLTSYPGDPAVGTGSAQPLDFSPNPDFFTGGADLTQSTDISTWTPKAAVAELTPLWGDPRNVSTVRVANSSGATTSEAVTALSKVDGQYDNLTLFDLEGPLASIAPNPYNGGDRKEITSTTGCDRNSLSWGAFDLAPAQSMTIWQVDLTGAGSDGAYDVYLRAQDVWMQRKYNPANDTFYWDGSNDRIIPTYSAAGTITGSQTVNLGRTATSGAVFHPPPPPTLSVFPTASGTVMLAWGNNAETAIDPGTGAVDFARYRVYRASGFIDQFPTATVAHPIGYNSTIIPPNMGLSDGATAITDVTDPTAATVKQSHPYARFIQEGLVIGADYNIGRVFDFVTSNVNKFAAPLFAGPYVQIAEFGGGGSDQTNTFNPPATVDVPNPIAAEDRFAGFTEDTVTTIPNSRQILEVNTTNSATTAVAVTFPGDRYTATPFANVEGIAVDSRLAGTTGYMWEDTSTLIGFNYWYYVASVDNESAEQLDFDSILQDPTGSSRTQISRTIVGLESFYTMNSNGTDGRWHGTFPYRGRTVGPEVPGQEVVPTTVVRNSIPPAANNYLDLVTVAPNPFVFQALWDLAVPGQQSVKFFNMPVPSRITIFDAAGLQVRQFNVPDASETQTTGGVTSWDLKNNSNVPVSGGLYICVIEAELPAGSGNTFSKTLKLYVRR